MINIDGNGVNGQCEFAKVFEKAGMVRCLTHGCHLSGSFFSHSQLSIFSISNFVLAIFLSLAFLASAVDSTGAVFCMLWGVLSVSWLKPCRSDLACSKYPAPGTAGNLCLLLPFMRWACFLAAVLSPQPICFAAVVLGFGGCQPSSQTNTHLL